MLTAAAARIAEAQLTRRVHLVRASMDRLPLAAGRFDWIVAHGIWNLARSGSEFRQAVREAARVSRPGSGDGSVVFLQPETWSYHRFELYLRRKSEGEGEAARRLSLVFFGAVGVGTLEPDLLVPERGQVEAALRRGHPDE